MFKSFSSQHRGLQYVYSILFLKQTIIWCDFKFSFCVIAVKPKPTDIRAIPAAFSRASNSTEKLLLSKFHSNRFFLYLVTSDSLSKNFLFDYTATKHVILNYFTKFRGFDKQLGLSNVIYVRMVVFWRNIHTCTHFKKITEIYRRINFCSRFVHFWSTKYMI